MSILNALRAQHAAKAKELNDLAEKPVWNAANDQPVYDAGVAELDELKQRIENINRLNASAADAALNNSVIEAAERRGVNDNNEGLRLYAKFLRAGFGGLTAEEAQKVRATMSTTTGSEGGYTVATEVAKTVLDALKAYGGMRAVANVIRTANGAAMSFPTSDGTSEEGEILAENAGAASADVDFGTKSLSVFKYSSKIVAVPIELLQDSSVDIAAFVNQRINTRLGRITNKHFTTGSGSGQPNGVVTAATVGVTAANSTSQVTAVTYDSLINLIHAVDPAYRELGRCRFMFHDSTLRELRKMKDGDSRPIFAPGWEGKDVGVMPDRLLGYPVTINQNVAAMAASAKSILFGDFTFYAIRDAMDITMFRFTDSAYAKNGQVGFLAFLRSGGNLVDVGGAVKVFVNAAS